MDDGRVKITTEEYRRLIRSELQLVMMREFLKSEGYGYINVDPYAKLVGWVEDADNE